MSNVFPWEPFWPCSLSFSSFSSFFFFELLIVKELAQEQGFFLCNFFTIIKNKRFFIQSISPLQFHFIFNSTKKNVHNFVHVLAYFSITFFLYLAKVFEYFLVNFVLESIEWPPINCFLSHENDLKFQYTSPVKFNCMNSSTDFFAPHTFDSSTLIEAYVPYKKQ